MKNAIDEIQRIKLKLFIEDSRGSNSPQPRDFIPIFHEWIQKSAVNGVLIDIANYDHLPDGPGVMLITHEGNYCIERRNGCLGLQYSRKYPIEAPLPQRLMAIWRILLKAAQLLKEEPQLSGRIEFRGDEIQIIANDRLLAPNTEVSLTNLQPVLTEFLNKLYGPSHYQIFRDADPRELLTLTVKSLQPVPFQTLLDRTCA